MLTVWKTLVLWYKYIMYCAVNCNKTIKRQKLDANLVIPYFHKSVISSRNEVRLFSPVKIIDAVNSLKSNEFYNDYNCTMTKPYLWQKSFQIMKRIWKKKNIMEAVCLGNRNDIHWFQEQVPLWPPWLAPSAPYSICYTSLVYCQLVCLLLVGILNLSSLYKLLGCFENKLFQLNAS